MEKYKSRNDVPLKYRWDLSDFFKDEADFLANYDKAVEDVSSLGKYIGCTKNSDKLYEFLKKDIEVCSMVLDLYVYAYLINDQELGISESMERKAKTEKLYSDYSSAVSFFDPELLELSKEEYTSLFENEKLLEFKNNLDKIYRNKEHILSKNEEVIINELTSAMNHYDDMSATMLNQEHDYGKIIIDGNEELITTTNYRKLMKNNNRETRKKIRCQFLKVLNQYAVSSAQFLDSYVKMNVAECKIRKYDSCFDAKLFSLNMPNEVFESLINTTESHNSSYQKYLKLFKKVHKLDELYPYDLNLDFAKSDKKYEIEEAQELCLKAIEPLGSEYVKLFKKVFDNRYIDYAQYKGKCSGGYSFATYDKDSKILMSFNGDLDSVSTMIHEGGHNVNHQIMNEKNPIQYRDTSSIVAEVASLTNECLLSSYLAQNGETKEEKLSGLANIIGVINSNLFGAVREGHMEQDFYKYVSDGGTITKDYMINLTNKYMNNLQGNEVIEDEYSGLSWINRSHYYMSFYLYSYAICISVASYIASEILNGNEDILEKYTKFLAVGSDVWPIDAFKVLGVDLTKKDVYEKAIKYYESLLEKFDTIYNS
nr:oligoendopeptidase F family protein [Bacilli bacterium]